MSRNSNDSFYREETVTKQPLRIRIFRLYLKLVSKFSEKRAVNLLVKLFTTPRVSKKFIQQRYEVNELFVHGETRSVPIEDLDIFVYEEGEPQVLLVYGWESSMMRFETLMDELRERDIGFVAFDHPASGYSSGDINHAVLTSRVISVLLEKYPGIRSIIGHSFGGGASFLALEQNTSVEKLVTVATPTIYKSVTEPFFLLLGIESDLRNKFNTAISELVGRDFTQYDLSRLQTADSLQYLIIHDKYDKTIPCTDAMRFAESHSEKSELFLTEGLGHRKIMHNPEVINRIVSFISGH